MPSFSSASISPKVITACLALIACYAPLVHPHILRAQVMPPSPDQSPPQLLTQSKEQSQTQMGIALIGLWTNCMLTLLAIKRC